jgi:alpha-tubulin suppressor-like RCC1 family protein
MVKRFHRIQLLLAAVLIFSLPNQVGVAQTGTSGSYRQYLPLVTTLAGNNHPPGVPANPSPADQATGQAITNLLLSWSGADPDGDAVTYSVYLEANSSNPTSLVSAGQAATQVAVSSLSPTTSYVWKVVARDSQGATTSGPVWHFTTSGGSGPLPSVDVKVNGGDGPLILTDQDSFTVSWASANASACTGSGGMVGRTGTSGSFTDGPKEDGTYSYTMTCSSSQGQASDTVTVTLVEPLPIQSQTIAAGAGHTCALTQTGGVLCWGENINGQLGDGTFNESLTPVGVAGLSSEVSAIAAGSHHTCALTQTGGVLCWGWNYNGQLGNGIDLEYPGEDSPTPVGVVGLSSGVSAVAAGGSHTCALTQTGGVLCWGYNQWNGNPTGMAIPVGVAGLTSGVLAIAAGDHHTCALTQDGGALCWGENDYGQLGDGTFTDSNSPVGVVGLPPGVRAIAAGGDHTCALTQEGGVLCWGDNSYGQLGNGAINDQPPFGSPTPVEVAGLSSGVSAVAAGSHHTCVLTQAGASQCWGNNESGQLGDGTHTGSSTPVAVVGFP